MSPPARFASIASSAAGARNVPCQHAIAESRSKALDLRLDALRHVERGSVGHMTIGPQNMFSFGRTRWIVERGLRYQHKRLFGFAAIGNFGFGSRNLLKRSAQVNRDCPMAICRAPRNRLRKSVIDLERSRRALEPLQLAFVFGRKPLARDFNQLTRVQCRRARGHCSIPIHGMRPHRLG